MPKPKQHPIQSPRWFLSKEVALILNTDEWRIRNFGSTAYGLQKEIQSPGSGNRRRYFFEVVLKLAIADELYRANISPAGINSVLKLIKSHKAIEKWIAAYGSESVPEMVLSLDSQSKLTEEDGRQVARIERVWKVLDSEQAESVARNEIERGSVAISLDLVQLWESIVQRITDLEAAKEI